MITLAFAAAAGVLSPSQERDVEVIWPHRPCTQQTPLHNQNCRPTHRLQGRFVSVGSCHAATVCVSRARARARPDLRAHIMSWVQREIRLPACARGCHLVTSHVTKAIGADLAQFQIGMCHIFSEWRVAVRGIGTPACLGHANVTAAWAQIRAVPPHAVQHTSASLTLNENADPDVRVDMEKALNHIVPEGRGAPWIHTAEGEDDM